MKAYVMTHLPQHSLDISFHLIVLFFVTLKVKRAPKDTKVNEVIEDSQETMVLLEQEAIADSRDIKEMKEVLAIVEKLEKKENQVKLKLNFSSHLILK